MTYLFQDEDELEFKRSFVIHYLASREANIKIAESMANEAWEKWKEIIGVGKTIDVLEQLQERYDYCLEMELECYRCNNQEIAKNWSIKASECEKAIAIVTGQPLEESQ